MKIEIENLKGISKLDFDIPGQGLWLLTGLNGSGKTSLLTTLYRIRHGRAFQDYFKTTATQSKLDTFKGSKVRYIINQDQVTYSYAGKRWPPTPRRNSDILSSFPYPDIQFVEANGKRVEPYSDEIQARRINNADEEIRSFLIYVLQDNKWDTLKFVNTRRGTGNKAFLIPYRDGRETHYYSEKNFSLGELCVLKLARKLVRVDAGSMILIDEIEMALHPQAQVRMLAKIQEISDAKNLTVIFSTHSSTLIKNINRQKIIFISRNDQGEFITKTNVFPAQVLGEIAYDEEIGADFIFFVEDEQAKLLLEQACGKYEENRLTHKPMYKVVPVGGYVQVMQMLERSSHLFSPNVKRYAFLDEDVNSEALPEARRNNSRVVLDLYGRVENITKFLPCTPEIGVVDMLEGFMHRNNLEQLNIQFPGSVVRLQNHLGTASYTNIQGDSVRKVAKNKLDSIAGYASGTSGCDDVTIRRVLYRRYIDHKYQDSLGDLMGWLGPVFNSR